MDLLVKAARNFNYLFPWHQPKPSVSKRIAKRLDTSNGLSEFGEIHGKLRMHLDLSIDFERDIYLNTSNMGMRSVFRKLLRPGDVMIDGGANIGFLSLIAWQSVGKQGKVYAFEPQPTALQRLQANIALNTADNIVAIAKALWHEPGNATLFEFTGDDHDLPSLGRRPDKSVGQEFTVETVRLDDMVKEPVRLIKLDIEGAEWAALKGAKRILFGGPTPHVIAELNPTTCSSFDHDPIEIVDWFFDHKPNLKMHLIRRRRHHRVNRSDLVSLFKEKPNKSHNVWFEPIKTD